MEIIYEKNWLCYIAILLKYGKFDLNYPHWPIDFKEVMRLIKFELIFQMLYFIPILIVFFNDDNWMTPLDWKNDRKVKI